MRKTIDWLDARLNVKKAAEKQLEDVSEDLSEGEKGENMNDVSVHIIRIPFGQKDKYVPKELL